ncbi:MAG: hypothetical protein WAW80_04695 [Candidatus Saccharimonadales bacterium]
MNKPTGITKHIQVIFFLVLILIVTATALYGAFRSNNTGDKIDSFDKCVAANNVVQETYPERCVTRDGHSFTKKY